MEVGSAFVRIRPFVADEDVRALEALDRLSHDVAAAFDRFREDQAPSALPASMTSAKEETG